MLCTNGNQAQGTKVQQKDKVEARRYTLQVQVIQYTLQSMKRIRRAPLFLMAVSVCLMFI